MKTTRRAVWAVLVALVLGGLAVAPARAAAKPQSAAKSQPTEDTWRGNIQKDGSHYDYVGRACPESAQICYDIVANYRIVALNPAAARAVRRLAGGQARLHGHLEPARDRQHTGTLFVRKAERPAPTPSPRPAAKVSAAR